ncbi:MAG: squalene/phytoene synthase family protein [Candidatus Micrarchaeia archaeon]
MNETDKCWQMLPQVSRSFALCIRVLPNPISEQMMLSYLVYRILDTIEDSKAPLDEKKRLFDGFLGLLSGKENSPQAAEKCAAEMLEKLDCTYERELLAETATVARAFFAQPRPARKYILKWGRVMAKGMYEFQKRRIETFEDQNKYSYYVAGVIGHLFNDLLYLNKVITLKIKRRLQRYAVRFGLALQKVNILRDIAADLKSNRCYWPTAVLSRYGLTKENICSREKRSAAMKVLHEQVQDARDYLYAAMKYILLLPKKALRVRMFCLIPLFMAAETYAKCIDNNELFDDGKVVKIGRLQVQEIVAKSGLIGSSNEKLTGWFIETMLRAGPDFVRDEYKRSLAIRAPAA